MANDVGYLRQEDIPALKAWLDVRGVGWNPGIGLWEVIRIAYGGHNSVVTRNKQEHYKTPVELRPLLLEFREFMASHEEPETKDEITDSERLVFMLEKHRQVVTASVGFNGHGDNFFEVYVQEGFMGEKRYPSAKFTGNLTTKTAFATKREAIDLAIIESRGESSV
jgi:hypothetical protein